MELLAKIFPERKLSGNILFLQIVRRVSTKLLYKSGKMQYIVCIYFLKTDGYIMEQRTRRRPAKRYNSTILLLGIVLAVLVGNGRNSQGAFGSTQKTSNTSNSSGTTQRTENADTTGTTGAGASESESTAGTEESATASTEKKDAPVDAGNTGDTGNGNTSTGSTEGKQDDDKNTNNPPATQPSEPVAGSTEPEETFDHVFDVGDLFG